MENIDLHLDGLKKTASRQAIIAILEKAKRPLTAEEVYQQCPASNLSTVYRTLTLFYANGYLVKEINNDGKATFAIHKPNHRHVLVCTKCHKKIYLDECPYEQANEGIKEKTGFTVTSEHTEIYGVCSDCQKEK